MRGVSILHADLDAFYASVEVRDAPDLAGRPVAVGGGVILSATYPARLMGVQAPMTVGTARRRCPDLIVVPARFEAYVTASRQVMEIIERYTPTVEAISIDEAFLDVSGSLHLFGDGRAIAEQLRQTVRTEVGLPISVGIATTKHLAKIASRVAKPDSLCLVPAGDEESFLAPLPVGYLWGIGPVTAARLSERGVATIGDLAALPGSTLRSWLGDHWGAHLSALAHNRDPRTVDRDRRRGSVGAQSAGPGDDIERRHRTVLALADRVGTRLRRKRIAGRRITVRARFDDMRVVSRACTLPGPVAETATIHHVAAGLIDRAIADSAAGRGITLVGLAVSLLEAAPHLQLSLLGDDVTHPGSTAHRRQADLDAAVDRARGRFGRHIVRRGATVIDPIEERSPIDHLDGA